jgi:acetyltransferase EpsM
MTERYLIIGAGGYAAEVADMIGLLGGVVVGYYDEHPTGDRGYGDPAPPVLTSLDGVECDAAAIAIGDAAVRARLHPVLRERFALPPLVHPSAYVSPSVTLAEGVLVMNNVVITARARVDACALLNVGCYVAHDTRVGAYAHLAGGVQLGGFSSVAEGVFCGTGSIVLPSVHVGEWSTCGAGSVVTKDVEPRTTVVGVPARPVRAADGTTAR